MIVKAADPSPSTTRKRARSFLRNNVDGKDVIVVPEVLPDRSRKEQVLLPRITAPKKASSLEPGNEEKIDEEGDYLKSEEHFDDGKCAVFPSGTKERTPYNKMV